MAAAPYSTVIVKKRPDCGAFLCDNTYAAIHFSKYYYDTRYKMNFAGT